jgi:hypothetical protein
LVIGDTQRISANFGWLKIFSFPYK